MPLPVLRVSLGGVTTLKGTICRESPLSPGKSPRAFAGFKNPSQAVPHQEEEAVGVVCPESCLFLTVPGPCPCSTCGEDEWKSHDTLLVLRLLCFSRIVVAR